MSTTTLPPGYSPPSTVITDTDHSGWITITTALGLACVLLCLAIRFYIPTGGVGARFRTDDAILTAGTVLSVVQSSIVFLEVSKGMGQSVDSLSDSALVQIQKIAYASDILYLLALYLSKCCCACLFMYLTPNKIQIGFSKTVLLASTIWVIMSIFLATLRCNLSHPWITYHTQCTNLFLRWQIIAAFDIIIEICLFAMAIHLVYGLQMAMKQKTTVVIAFGFRLPIIVFAILRLRYLNDAILASNPTLTGALLAVWTQVELDYSIIAGTIPGLKPFMTAVSTNYGAIDAGKGSGTQSRGGIYGSGDRDGASHTRRSKMGSYGLQSISTPKEVHFPRPTSLVQQSLRGDTVHSATRVTYNGQGDRNSLGSNDSTKMIIKKEMQWTVERDGEKLPGITVTEGGSQDEGR